MASNFSANWGSLPTLNVRDRWGFRPCLCQIRRTLFSLSLATLAMTRVLQCVALLGFSCAVFRTTSWILAGVMVEAILPHGSSVRGCRFIGGLGGRVAFTVAACHHRSFRRWVILLQKGEGRVSLGIAQGRQYPAKKGRQPQVRWAAAP